MKETLIWKSLKGPLSRLGKFQKISDRFSGGVPDVLGSRTPDGRGVAMELKESGTSRLIKVRFRPRQLDWLLDWEASGALSWVVVSQGDFLYAFLPTEALERGIPPDHAAFKVHRRNQWDELANFLVR